MSRKERRAGLAEEGEEPPALAALGSTSTVTASSLAALLVLGILDALWGLFLWAELLVARAGGVAFCALGEASSCAAVWDSAFASSVHRTTGLPIAGWGLAWGLVATALPLCALWRRAEGRADDPSLATAIKVVSAAGVLTVFVMMGVSASQQAFCSSCAVAYVVVGAYAGIALFGWTGHGLPALVPGAATAAGATLCAFLLLLYPGTRTPATSRETGRQAMSGAAAAASGTGDAATDQRLAEFVAQLQPQAAQMLSDSLAIYRAARPAPPPEPRALHGAATAPVRITEFTDVRCEHCADLHATLASLGEHLPAGSFAVDSRQFPLDGECNPLVQAKADPVRCLAARARICVEGHQKAQEFAGALFRQQATLTAAQVYEAAAPLMAKAKLEQCVASQATQERLAADIAAAQGYDPEGTPIVVVNGRKGTSFGPFLFAISLTRGATEHPAFAGLPAPNPNAHMH